MGDVFTSKKGRWWAEHVVNLRGHILIEFAGATCEPHGLLKLRHCHLRPNLQKVSFHQPVVVVTVAMSLGLRVNVESE